MDALINSRIITSLLTKNYGLTYEVKPLTFKYQIIFLTKKNFAGHQMLHFTIQRAIILGLLISVLHVIKLLYVLVAFLFCFLSYTFKF